MASLRLKGYRRRNRFFAWNKHGREQALQKAVAWRQEQEAIAHTTPVEKNLRPTFDGSGHLPFGVHRITKKKRGREFLYYVAALDLQDGKRQAAFSLYQLGDRMALAMAIQTRRKFEQVLRRSLTERGQIRRVDHPIVGARILASSAP